MRLRFFSRQSRPILFHSHFKRRRSEGSRNISSLHITAIDRQVIIAAYAHFLEVPVFFWQGDSEREGGIYPREREGETSVS